jgi:hypothetical protein
MTNTETKITFYKPPEPVGYWCLYGDGPTTKFAMFQKPTDEQIKNTTELLGWVWEDAK